MPGRLRLCDIWKGRRAQFFLVVAVVSAIPFLCTGSAAPWWAMNDLTIENLQGNIGTLSRVTAPGSSAHESYNLAAASSQWSLAEMDRVLGIKGWNYAPPSFAESVMLDYGGWRSSLASVGIGLIEYNVTRFQANVLDTPREGPRFSSFYDSAQSYWGQKPSFHDISALALIYDLSRFGVPDGQLQPAGNFNYATYQGFNPNTATFHFLAYYQTLFDRQLEIKFGLVGNQNEFVGQNIGGGFASTGGPANSIITLLGMSASPVSTWSFRITGHLGNFYNETAVMRSLVVNGPTGNALFDTNELNPTRLDWNVNTSSYSPTAEVGAPRTSELFVNEFGYEQDATPSSLYTWARSGRQPQHSP